MSDTLAAEAPAPAESTPAPVTETTTPAPEVSKSPAQAKEDALDARLSEIFDKLQDQPRDEGGKFASRTPKESEPAPVAAAEEPDIDETTTDQPQTEGNEQPGQPKAPEAAIAPPQSWSADLKAKWESIPPDVREFIAKRESESHSTISRMGNELSQYRPLGELLVAHKDVFERHRVPVVQGITQLLTVQRDLDANPEATLQAIANAYSVDLRKLAGLQEQEAAPGNPELAGLRNTVDQLQRQLAQREATEQEAVRRWQEEQQQKTNQEVAEWANKDKPYYAKVKLPMAALIANGSADTLDQAYDMACWGDPEIRQKLIQDQQKAEETKRLAENARKVTEVKKAVPLNKGTTRRMPTAPSGKWDSDDALSAIFDRAAAS